jgi:hypothetical protein
MKLRAQGFSTNKRQGLVGTIVVLTDDDQPTGVEHFGNYSRDVAKGLFKKLQDAGFDPEPVKPKLHELLKELRGVADAAASAATSSDSQPNIPYIVTANGLAWLKPSETGTAPVPLTNFTAQIVSEQLRDDGLEVQRSYEIAAILNGHTYRFPVPANHFSSMGWTAEHLGAQAIVFPGFSLKDHARAAIQFLSGQVAIYQVFTHTGWRKVNGLWMFLHGDGAIGPTGQLRDVTVDLPEALQQFRLPDPPAGDDLRSAVQVSLEFLEVAGVPVTIPMYCAIWRAVLSLADHSVHLSGPTGSGKSELAALAQQHFGPGMDARHLPGSWSSTANALEGLAFAAKDVLLVVDDFAPTGSVADIQRMHREADRLLRAQGNFSARLRMRSDSSLRVPKPPRSLILSTGEDIPKGQSLRARLMVVEVPPAGADGVNWERLTVCQGHAATGRFAQAMSGFLRWLAPQYEDLQPRLAEQVAALAIKARSIGQHQRAPYNVASLALGLHYFLRFAAEMEALSESEVDDLWQRSWRALTTVAAAQADYQASSEPTRRFLQLLAAALASGQAHVAAPDGSVPVSPQSWGWWQTVVGPGDHQRTEWRPQGLRIGWVQSDDLYLESDAAFAVAQQLGREGGEALSVTLQTLKKRLKEQGLLASTESIGGRERLEVRRTLEGNRRTVLHLRSSTLVVPEVCQVRQVRHNGSDPHLDTPSLGANPGALPPDENAEVCQKSGTPSPVTERESPDDGAIGALGTLLEGIAPEYSEKYDVQASKANDPWDAFLKGAEE